MSAQATINHLFGKALEGFVDGAARDAPRKFVAARATFKKFFHAVNDLEAREYFAAYEVCENMCLAAPNGHQLGVTTRSVPNRTIR